MAETQGQRRQALRQMQGALRERAESWRERLTRALALIEARIDFSDEADVQNSAQGDLIALALARELEGEIAAALADDKRGERLREGLVVAIAGPPNAGKSTLLNRIARREAAIVSPYAGTTRDVIEVHLDLAGWPVTLLDTAGIRDSDDPVEREGVRRARDRAAAADLVLWVVDASEPAQSSAVIPFGPPGNDDDLASPSPPTWLVRNKIDAISGIRRNESTSHKIDKNEPPLPVNEPLKDIVNNGLARSNEIRFTVGESVFNLSATTGEGFELLLAALTRHADGFLAGAEPALITRERHRRILEDALAALRRAGKPEVASREDLLAEELRLAARALGRLTGRVDVEDILDVIFRDFCIGK
jgi:tRNA modification GTPase